MSTTTRPKVRSIKQPEDPLAKGLPCNLDAERFLLGAVLQAGHRFSEIAALGSDDFSTESHRRVFLAMRELHVAGDPIEYISVAEQTGKYGPPESFGFLAALTDGVPHGVALGGCVKILREKNRRRQTIVAADMAMRESLAASADPAQVLDRLTARIEEILGADPGQRQIRRIEDLQSIFTERTPTEYLVVPELPARAIVCLTGDSESGKTTLACAWARDLLARGHAALLLDRDKNPRDRVCDRLERLGIPVDSERLWVWDSGQSAEPPQPNDPIVVNWVKRMVAETGKSPLIIADSLVSFLLPDEDENSAVNMRAVFNRFRVAVKYGATGILIHHTNRSGEARGSSDFKPSSDQAFLVKNKDRAGGRLLDLITLQFEKSRYGLAGEITYHYAGGKMERAGKRCASNTQALVDLLKANPGMLTEEFVAAAIATGTTREKARDFLKKGVEDGVIEVEVEGRRRRHWVRGCRPSASATD